MIPGWIRWDDADDKNGNSKGGSLPDGSYGKNTNIKYCCQTEGQWYDVIELPVSQPFYLLTSSSIDAPKCQMVKWAFSYLEYIVFDTEDNNNYDGQGGKHVFKDGDKLFYCYYESCSLTMTGPSETLTSHKAAVSEMDPRSQYCSWLITIAESYIVSLMFEELNIPNCNDTFLRIYDGSNDTAPLLGTYCGSNASAELVDISSSTNSLFIVSNSGSYERNPKSTFSFKAQYNAEHLTGCRHEVKGSTGYLKSPKFDTPRNYPNPHHSNCSWLVTVDDAYLVTLNFSSLKLLDNDVINIYDGGNENAPVLARYSRLNVTGNIVSSLNSVFIILKYGESSNYQSMFAFHYASQTKPTEKIKILQTTSTSVISTVSTQGPNSGSAKQSENNQTTYIIVAVVVGVAVVLILIAILIFLRRRRKKGDTSSSLHGINPSYSWRKKASASDEDSVYYANPSSPQEKVWVGNSRVCKEGRNPIYEPMEGPEPPALYASPDNTYEPLVENQGHAAQSENPLYGVGEVAIPHVYAEPSSQKQNILYDEPDVKV
ncbi:Hypothetical predicted protein [Paramuricea clavata]|uniref:Uncharacterized protein n=1 Tax=Paramuricea clavata TaxID=317549 RepID=A0A6S7IQS5_PARCT|nr:Hypothetical predicted protein [Paramuricea clavata]